MEKRIQVHIPYPILLERYEEVLERGINPEVYIDGDDLYNFLPSDLLRMRKGFEERGLTVTMHGPYEGLNPGSKDEKKRLLTVERYSLAFRAASLLSPKTIVLHAGYSESKFKGDKGLWLEKSLMTWPPFVKEAERLGVVVAVENIFEKEPDTLKTLVETIGSRNFRVCLDSGHLNAFARTPLDMWFKELGQYLAEVHIHDNHGESDEHLPIGDGAIDFPLFFSLLKTCSSDPVYTIEPHGEDVLLRGLEAVKKYI